MIDILRWGWNLRKKAELGIMVWSLVFVLSSCKPSLDKIEGRLSDTESELLDRWDHQPEINKEWNTYASFYWQWDEEQIRIMDKWIYRRSKRNIKKYNRLLGKRNGLLEERDDAIATWEEYKPHKYNEDELQNSNAAVRKSIEVRNEGSKKKDEREED